MTDGPILHTLATGTTAALTLAQQTQVPWWTMLLAITFLLICVIMILTVLIQRPQGGGLSGAFGSGGGGSGQTAFGTRTGDALTVATVAIFIIYLIVAIGLNYLAKPVQTAPGTPSMIPAPAEEAEDGVDVAPAPGAGTDDAIEPEPDAPESPDATTPGTDAQNDTETQNEDDGG